MITLTLEIAKESGGGADSWRDRMGDPHLLPRSHLQRDHMLQHPRLLATRGLRASQEKPRELGIPAVEGG